VEGCGLAGAAPHVLELAREVERALGPEGLRAAEDMREREAERGRRLEQRLGLQRGARADVARRLHRRVAIFRTRVEAAAPCEQLVHQPRRLREVQQRRTLSPAASLRPAPPPVAVRAWLHPGAPQLLRVAQHAAVRPPLGGRGLRVRQPEVAAGQRPDGLGRPRDLELKERLRRAAGGLGRRRQCVDQPERAYPARAGAAQAELAEGPADVVGERTARGRRRGAVGGGRGSVERDALEVALAEPDADDDRPAFAHRLVGQPRG
jgi:hypothetical protein